MASQVATIDFTLGSRRLLAVPRHLVTISFSLNEIIRGQPPALPEADQEADGIRVLSAPADRVDAIIRDHPDHVIGGRQDYPRHYIDMAGSYDDYLARFSAKTRSTLRRKQRKLAK